MDVETALRRGRGRRLAWAQVEPGDLHVQARGVPDGAAFEWGPITRTVTGTLLALMVADGTVGLQTRLSDLLPDTRRCRGGRA